MNPYDSGSHHRTLVPSLRERRRSGFSFPLSRVLRLLHPERVIGTSKPGTGWQATRVFTSEEHLSVPRHVPLGSIAGLESHSSGNLCTSPQTIATR